MSTMQRVILILVALLALAALGAGAWLIWGAAPPAASPAEIQPPAPLSSPAVLAQTPTAPAQMLATPTAALATFALPSPASFDPLACLPGDATAGEAQVKGILGGALLQVDQGGKTFEVSLLGVDPAGSGAQAQGLLRELVEGKTVRLLPDRSQPDGTGRPARYVLSGQVFVNFELVRRGAALPAQYPPGLACIETLLNAERLARADGAGYWSLAAPVRTELPAATSAAAACDCSKTYACTDFSTRAQAQACYNACGDYRNTTLDPDHNGIACEQMP